MKEKASTTYLEDDFKILRDPIKGKERIMKKIQILENNSSYLKDWYDFSRENGSVYPDQGLLTTPHDYLDFESKQMLPQEKIIESLRIRFFLLEMSNHPYRINFLKETQKKEFKAPIKIQCKTIENAEAIGLSLSIGDLEASVVGTKKERQSRTQRYAEGPFVKLGKHARILFTGSDSPDVWNSSTAISTMAASFGLATLPRNGIMASVERQANLAKETFQKLENLKDMLLTGRADADEVHTFWKNNVGAVLEATTERALVRAEKLYKEGVRTFRIYSPEPGIEIITTTKAIRKNFGSEVEIFAGQAIDVDQSKRVEEAGADGIFVGIGGGGRCITGIRSGSAIDWPMLVWNLRGEISIPVIAEGGASDHVNVSLLLGASAISTSRVVAGGTMESPGGVLYLSDKNGRLFKPYGGEASARTKYLENKVLPFNITPFIEGETTRAEFSYIKDAPPTLAYNLHLLNEEAILSMVFRNVGSISELQNLNPSPLKRVTSFNQFQSETH